MLFFLVEMLEQEGHKSGSMKKWEGFKHAHKPPMSMHVETTEKLLMWWAMREVSQ